MTEFQLYDKNGLFHQIVKQSAIMNGRYAVLPKGAHDLNLNNLLSGLDLPTEKGKYPGVFMPAPTSELPCSIQAGQWEDFNFRPLFLCTTNYTGDNKIKSPDFNTNSSLHTVSMDWSDMKTVALGFMGALEQIQKLTRGQFRMSQKSTWRIIRLTKMGNDQLSGVMVMFGASIAVPCEFEDINISAIELPTAVHAQHFH
jgi:hypothetical protein